MRSTEEQNYIKSRERLIDNLQKRIDITKQEVEYYSSLFTNKTEELQIFKDNWDREVQSLIIYKQGLSGK